MKIYYIGGSPCSGKSTVAEILAAKHGYYYYKLDDKLEEFMTLAAADAKPRVSKYFTYSSDEIWLRDPAVQFEDEVGIYGEMAEYVVSDIGKLGVNQPVIAEGAGFTPDLMKQMGVGVNNYFCIVPTSDFQIENYRKRQFVSHVLQDCSEKEKAFDNWMQRDILFARYVADAAQKMGYETLWIDGTKPPEAVVRIVERRFLI